MYCLTSNSKSIFNSISFILVLIVCGFKFKVTHYIFLADTNYSFRCELSNYNTDPMAMYAAYMCYGYFILKLTDYFDTIFFILRKKDAHVSFLHVYHHVAVSVAAYICVLFATGLYRTHTIFLLFSLLFI